MLDIRSLSLLTIATRGGGVPRVGSKGFKCLERVIKFILIISSTLAKATFALFMFLTNRDIKQYNKHVLKIL